MGNNIQAHSTQTTTARQGPYSWPSAHFLLSTPPRDNHAPFSGSLEFRPDMEPKQLSFQVKNVLQ